MEDISIVPNAAKLIESLRYLTYTNESAIADIVDNSFDASADNVNIYINKDDCIIIIDDGCGMSLETMKEAIKLGSDTEKAPEELGRFGMGLVTASISMGKCLEVTSKTEDGEPHKVVLDLGYIKNKNEWKALYGELDENEKRFFEVHPHGTIVKISALDHVKSNAGAVTARHLRQVFREFLFAGKHITVNGEDLKAIDPLSRDLSDTEILLEEDIEIGNGKVHVIVAHLDSKKGDLAAKYADDDHIKITIKDQGFYVIRNNREIAAGEDLGIYTRHAEATRFRCELSYTGDLDEEFGINFMKHNVNLSQALSDKIKAKVAPLINFIQNDGRRKAQVSKSEKVEHDEAENIIKRKGSLLRSKTNWNEKHKKPTPKPKPDKEPKDDPEEDKKKRDRKNIRKVQVGNRVRPAEIREADLGEFSPLFDCFFEGNKIVIRWNIRHPFHAQLIARYGKEKNVTTPIDLLIYSLSHEILSLDDDDDRKTMLMQAISSMSDNLRALMR